MQVYFCLVNIKFEMMIKQSNINIKKAISYKTQILKEDTRAAVTILESLSMNVI